MSDESAEKERIRADSGRERRAIQIAVMGFISAVAAVVISAMALPGDSVDEPWAAIALLAAALAGLGLGALAMILRGHSKILPALLFSGAIAAIAAAGWSYTLLHAGNRLLDSSEPVARSGVVLDSRSGGKGPGRSRVQMDGDAKEIVTIIGQHRRGRRAELNFRSGAFGWRWLESAQVQPKE